MKNSLVFFIFTFSQLFGSVSWAGIDTSMVKNRWQDLHPAFRPNKETLQQIWDKGYEDAKSARDTRKAENHYRRGIGSIRVNGFGTKETVSWLWLTPPQLIVYTDAFRGRKQYREPLELEKLLAEHLSGIWEKPETLKLQGIIRLMPSFGGSYGRIDRQPNPKDLENVRVVLKVGDKVYQPRKHPGLIEPVISRNTHTVQVPVTTETTIHSPDSGRGGGKKDSNKRIESTTYFYEQEPYLSYEGNFSAEFDLFNEDGTARVNLSHTEFIFIVIYGSNERHATYKLADFDKVRS